MQTRDLLIDHYFNEREGCVSFTREQASRFAKHVANDFNPLHDIDGKRFCVPGDLLFAVVLARYGLSQHMTFTFSGMVTDGVELILPAPSAQLQLKDSEEREYLRVTRDGETTHDASLIRQLVQSYVEFSGQTFPHILVPLLAEQHVMIHPDRPMVMYQSMAIDLDCLDIAAPRLQGDSNQLSITGKRGSVELAFHLIDGDAIVGRGRKHMLLSGLRDYEEDVVERAIAIYNDSKQAFLQ